MVRPFLFGLLLLGAGATPLLGEVAIDNAAHRALEERGMVWLEDTKMQDPASLSPFTSDGCSGGLSAGWELLAEGSEGFRERYGEHPPWESCCVEHDRVYWKGETEQGYDLRLEADRALRACVRETGNRQAGTLAESTGKSPEEVRQQFDRAADLMYVAVRLGGGPCTGLPWRWGYGWPQCPLRSEPSPPLND